MDKIIIASGPVIVENDKVLLNKHAIQRFGSFAVVGLRTMKPT